MLEYLYDDDKNTYPLMMQLFFYAFIYFRIFEFLLKFFYGRYPAERMDSKVGNIIF